MNIRDLQYIQAVAKYGHFGRAAAACHVSQPALSSQIKKLELELEVDIFERDNRSVRVTNVGQKIIDLAGDALDIVETIRATAQSARDPFSGLLNLGAIPTIFPYLIPDFIRKSQVSFPLLQLSFRENITENLNMCLLDGRIDAAILATPPDSPKFTSIPLYDEPFWVVFPKGHNLRMIEQLKTKDLPVDELLLLAEGHCFRDQALDVCQLGASAETWTIRATSLETLINMVIANQGITLVPATALNGRWSHDKNVHAERLKDKKAYRRIYLTYRKTFPRQSLLENLADLICDNVGQNVTRLR